MEKIEYPHNCEDDIPWSINAGMRIDVVRASSVMQKKEAEEPIFTIEFR